MQSSWIVVCRVLLIIACLVGLPLMALTGTGPMQLVDQIVEWSAATLERSSENRSASPRAAAAPAARPPARWAVGQMAAGGHNSSAEPSSAAPVARFASSAEALPARPVDDHPGSGGPLQRDPRPPWPAADVARQREERPAAVGSFSETAAVQRVEQRLRALGAVHYLLERWGEDGQIYRFQCRMAMNQDPNHFCSFQATDRMPLAAMQQVLAQIETWRSRSEAVVSRLSEPAVHVTRKVPPVASVPVPGQLLKP